MSKTKKGPMPAPIEHVNGRILVPGSDGYPDNANGELVIMLEDGEIITDFVSADSRGDPSDTAQEINKLLESGTSGQLVYVDCGDDQSYFYLKPGGLNWERIVDVQKLPMHVIDDLYAQHTTDKDYDQLSEREKEEILRRHLTGLTAREAFDQYLKYNGIINYNDTFIGVINALHKV